MSPGAVFANAVWAASNLGAARCFTMALREPEAAQSTWLKTRLTRDEESAFGREHGFGEIEDYAGFARRVPLRGWDEFSPWVERVRGGEANVLGMERVTHLAPTSGSSGARKLIPFTAGLQTGFSSALGTWMTDLMRMSPGVLGGPAYWSVSPMTEGDKAEAGMVRVGYADDAEYLGGVRAWLVRRALAAPAGLRKERDIDEFWRRTLVCVLARRDLRLISVWHPSFLELLIEAAERNWDVVCERIGNRARKAELRRLGRHAWTRWWPRLRVISCWGDQAAAAGWRVLQKKFPGVQVQPKGLLATEAAVTIPWRGTYPLAITSHFFEFVDEAGGVRRAHELERGRSYEVVVTNGGGLWRYRLGDVVECTGQLAATPTLRFLGRAGNVSDLRGEKLSEVFVAEVLSRLWEEGSARPDFAVLAVLEDPGSCGYRLYVERMGEDPACEVRLEALLARNPHYAWARKLGQLVHVTRRFVPSASSRRYLLWRQLGGTRLGDVKIPSLIRRPDELRILEEWAEELCAGHDCHGNLAR